MYRVFEALDELVTIVEEARGLPMTASCVVPRGDVLELLDDVRDALPGEVDDAQDVLDHRDQMIGERQRDRRQDRRRRRRPRRTGWSAPRMPTPRPPSTGARAEADRLVGEATAHADGLVARAQDEAARIVQSAQEQHDSLLARAHAEAERTIAAGRASYEGSVADGRAEQARLVSQTEVVQAAYTESARILDSAHADADRMRQECDTYVDTTLGSIEETLTTTLRTVGRGRTALRSGGVADFRRLNPAGARPASSRCGRPRLTGWQIGAAARVDYPGRVALRSRTSSHGVATSPPRPVMRPASPELRDHDEKRDHVCPFPPARQLALGDRHPGAGSTAGHPARAAAGGAGRRADGPGRASPCRPAPRSTSTCAWRRWPRACWSPGPRRPPRSVSAPAAWST